MNDRPPIIRNLEEWKLRNPNLIRQGVTDEQLISQIELGLGVNNNEEQLSILADWNARPEQVAKKKKQERNGLILMIGIAMLLASIAMWWIFTRMPNYIS